MEILKRTKRYLYFLLGLIGTGTIGYRVLEDWSWLDSLYVTVVTLATVGYGDIVPKSSEGRIFTVVFILVGVGSAGYVVTNAIQALVQTAVTSSLNKRRMFKDISKLEDHYIICGSGRVGQRLIKEMQRQGVEFVVIERDEHLAERLLQHGHLTLNGDATDEDTLLGAGIQVARGIVCCASTDADNVYITLTARGLNEKIYIVARATEESAIPKLRKAGANRVVSPVLIGSHQMAQVLLRPAVADFIELTTMTEGLDLAIEQVQLSGDSPLIGKKLRETNIRSELDIIVVAVRHANEDMTFNPSGTMELREGDFLVVIGGKKGLDQLAQIAGAKSGKITRRIK